MVKMVRIPGLASDQVLTSELMLDLCPFVIDRLLVLLWGRDRRVGRSGRCGTTSGRIGKREIGSQVSGYWTMG